MLRSRANFKSLDEEVASHKSVARLLLDVAKLLAQDLHRCR